MIALQRSAGNASTLALMRRGLAEEPPMSLILPGVVGRAAVSSWSLGDGQTRVDLTRRVDSDSPRLAEASATGAPGVTATLVVRRLTSLGWVHELTLTMDDCVVGSYQVHDEYESIGLTFSAVRVER
jgi:Type VI secretion system effector, Hcp